jgi:formimidoylglutamase
MKGRQGVLESLDDLGDLPHPSGDVEENHRRAIALVSEGHTRNALSVVVGGGHDHGYSHLAGLAASGRRLGCINIDAHLDVRKPEPLISSGSPFYLALERKVLEPARFIEFGIQSHCNAKPLWDYVESRKVEIIPFESLRDGRAVPVFEQALARLAASCDLVAISLDLDAAAQAFAPGVSAPQAEGFTSGELVRMMEVAGREPKASSLGIFELNPLHDVDARTARLAATCAYHFVAAALAASSSTATSRKA